MLALGAISEGCHRGLVPFMGPMVTMLTPKLSDERPLVRAAITLACLHARTTPRPQDVHLSDQALGLLLAAC